MTITIVKKVEVIESAFTERKLNGLKKRNTKQSRINFILKIERLLSNYRYACYSFDTNKLEKAHERLIKELKYTVTKIAKSWSNGWENKRLHMADFESLFYDTFLKLIDSYNWYTDFYFYETLILSWKRASLKMIRKSTLTKQGRFDNDLKALENVTDKELLESSKRFEDDVLTRMIMKEVLKEPSLTTIEKELIIIRYNEPYLSYLELAKQLGFSHHEPIRRMEKRITKKVLKSFVKGVRTPYEIGNI